MKKEKVAKQNATRKSNTFTGKELRVLLGADRARWRQIYGQAAQWQRESKRPEKYQGRGRSLARRKYSGGRT